MGEAGGVQELLTKVTADAQVQWRCVVQQAVGLPEPDRIAVLAYLYWHCLPFCFSDLAGASGYSQKQFLELVRLFAPLLPCPACNVPFRPARNRSDLRHQQVSPLAWNAEVCGRCLPAIQAQRQVEQQARDEYFRRGAEIRMNSAEREALQNAGNRCHQCRCGSDELTALLEDDASREFPYAADFTVLCPRCLKLRQRREAARAKREAERNG
jgi:hypothetical protein